MIAQQLANSCPRRTQDPGAAVYKLHGRRVRSAIALPCPRIADSESDLAEITLRLEKGEAPIPPDGSLRSWMPCPIHGEDQRVYRQGGETWFWQRDIATVHINARADCADVYLASDATDRDALGHFLLQPVLVHMLSLRGLASLHAGAAAFGDRAVALVGSSHDGKSTLAAGLVRGGAALLCDDALALERRDGVVYGVPGPAHLKLWPESVPDLLPDAHQMTRLTASCDKQVVALPAAGRKACGPLPVRAALLLARYDGDEAGRCDVVLSALPPSARLAALVAHMLGREHLLPTEEAALLPTFAALARQVDVRLLHYPSGLGYLEAVVEAIRAFVEAA